jgi:hypothetical protein
MNSLALLAEGSPQWFQDLLQPQVMPFLVAIVAIIGGISLCAVKAIIRHRERIAKIEHGIDPDARNEPH